MNYLMENMDVVTPMPWKKCRETTIGAEAIKINNIVWLTDNRPDKGNAAELAGEGRCRWIIENQ